MIEAFTDSSSYEYKICFDGLDLLTSEVGKVLVNDLLADQIHEHFPANPPMPEDQEWLEKFVTYCTDVRRANEPQHDLPIDLRDTYEVGLFTTSKDHPFANHPYALLNATWLELWDSPDTPTFELSFLVVPSRGLDGAINEIGFRVLDLDRVRRSFKWTFMFGQRATYGLNRVQDKTKIVLVEGAWDQIAFEQSNTPNVVGIGSLFITAGHKDELEGCSYSVCWDNDTFGIAQRSNESPMFFAPAAKDPFEAWCKHGSVSLVECESLISLTN